jgi:murein DD-endopeptidase MepM/ murein hydrolase activator NlpD
MRLLAAGVCATLVAACGGDKGGSGPEIETTRYAEPLAGTLNQTFFYLNYLDGLGGSGSRDYTCGPKTYDGHAGTDITLANFAVMDSGVAVRAAAAGMVVNTNDGEFDRQKRWVAGAVPNFVAIRHPDGVVAYYLHLKRNSVAVGIGDLVQAGDLLGYVGSSGFSDIPHLHFELRDSNGAVIDPWLGSCGAGESRWSAQLPYQNAFSLHAAGLTGATMTLDLAKDPPAPVTVFTTADPQVTMWVQLFNAPAGTALEFRLYRPDSTPYFSLTSTLGRFYGISWWWAWHAIPGYLTPGSWRMQYLNNGVVLAERAFEVVDANPQMRPTVQPARAGTGGGQAGRPRF